MFKRLFRMMTLMASAILVLGLPAAAAAAAAHPAASRPTHSAATQANRPNAVSGGCNSFDSYCDYSFTNPNFNSSSSQPCLLIDASLSNWDNSPQGNSCRNVDEAFDNNTPDVIRLHYSPNYNGAWICVPAHTGIESLRGKKFNNGGSGAAGFGQLVWNNVASSGLQPGSCSNPTT